MFFVFFLNAFFISWYDQSCVFIQSLEKQIRGICKIFRNACRAMRAVRLFSLFRELSHFCGFIIFVPCFVIQTLKVNWNAPVSESMRRIDFEDNARGPIDEKHMQGNVCLTMFILSTERKISRPLKASVVISQLVNTCRAQGHEGKPGSN